VPASCERTQSIGRGDIKEKFKLGCLFATDPAGRQSRSIGDGGWRAMGRPVLGAGAGDGSQSSDGAGQPGTTPASSERPGLGCGMTGAGRATAGPWISGGVS